MVHAIQPNRGRFALGIEKSIRLKSRFRDCLGSFKRSNSVRLGLEDKPADSSSFVGLSGVPAHTGY
jgi:hypothetical protein